MTEALAQAVLAAVRGMREELRPRARLLDSLGLDDSLERDYGLDSLARVELMARLERDCGIRLDEAALTEAETPRDLLRFVLPVHRERAAPPETAGAASSQRVSTPAPAVQAYAPNSVRSLLDVFEWHLQRQPQRVLITLIEEGHAALDLCYADLHRDATELAAGLAGLHLEPGQTVAIMLPTGREFFAAFFGALYAGLVPVPLYPPARPSQMEDHLQRVAAILCNAQARVLLTVERAKPMARLLRAQVQSLHAVSTVADLSRPGAPAQHPALQSTDLAFVQYTSGSTGDPKGVLLSHANLLANVQAMARASEVGGGDVFVSWLPLYHDMGLIGACLGALCLGFHLVLLSPLAFLGRPARWVEALSRYRGTVSAAPNFAYELCLAKVTDSDLQGLDLSAWRLAFNGAEPVSPDTLERFAERFAPCGFRREALTPVYGLAECSVGLAFAPVGRGPLVDSIDRVTLERQGLARPVAADSAGALRVVSCGLPLPGHDLRVIGRGARELPEREQGRVQFRGPSSTQGYLNNPAANARLFEGGWLNTGDLGYIAAGELFLTGREKDIIIRGGFNIHPQELETAVAALAGVRKGGVAVFAATDARSGTERLVVLAETALVDAAQREQLVRAITALSATLLGAPADDVVLAPPRSVLKTSSGKIRRAACRALYEQGRLGVTQRAPWRQWLSLAGDAALAWSWRTLHAATRLCWGLWAWLVVGMLAPLAWSTVVLWPGSAARRRVARTWMRAAMRLLGLPLADQGLERLSALQPCIVVVNHASYADAMVLTAVLPPHFVFAAKKELARVPLLGLALRRLGTAFVERVDAAEGVEDTRAIQARVAAGQSMVFFPEGALHRAAGLQAFRLGAFVIAAETATPLVPIALNGTRSLLRDGTWWPRRVSLSVSAAQAIVPDGPGWGQALALRDAARQAIAAKLGEAALNLD